jgi:hypothetical protein
MSHAAPTTPARESGLTTPIGVGSVRLLGPSTRDSKSDKFFARLLERRQTPGNCVRCGHKNPEPKHKTCPRCLDAVNRRKKAAAEKPTVTTRAMERRLESLELAVANLQKSHADIYTRAYNAGRRSVRVAMKRLSAEVQHAEDCRYELPTIHPQELATINHAYDRQH